MRPAWSSFQIKYQYWNRVECFVNYMCLSLPLKVCLCSVVSLISLQYLFCCLTVYSFSICKFLFVNNYCVSPLFLLKFSQTSKNCWYKCRLELQVPELCTPVSPLWQDVPTQYLNQSTGFKSSSVVTNSCSVPHWYEHTCSVLCGRFLH